MLPVSIARSSPKEQAPDQTWAGASARIVALGVWVWRMDEVFYMRSGANIQ